MYMLGWTGIIYMADDKTSILLSDVSVEGDLIEKDKIIIDAKINGDIKAEEIETHQKSNILAQNSGNHWNIYLYTLCVSISLNKHCSH